MSFQVPADGEARVQKLVDEGSFVHSDHTIREAIRRLEDNIR